MTAPIESEHDPERLDPENLEPDVDEPPPLGTWPRMYAAVLGSLALWIVLFYAFMRAFS